MLFRKKLIVAQELRFVGKESHGLTRNDEQNSNIA
jgi:hypothetical protein